MSNHDVTAVVPGIFYRSPGPGKPPYTEVGGQVAAGEAVGLVEIMKQFSEILSPVAGQVVEFLVEDGEMLAPGQVVARVQEASS